MLVPLPLPLTPFEEYMLADDRPQWPMTFFLRLQLQGEFSRPDLEAAVAARSRSPSAVELPAKDNGRQGFQWIAASGNAPSINYQETEDTFDLADARTIDLRSEIGWRMWVYRPDATRWIVWVQFHHACCDGIGALQVVSDWLAEYRSRIERRIVANLPPLDPSRLSGRGSFGLNLFRRILRLPQELLGLLGAVEFFLHRPPSLLSEQKATEGEQVTPSVAEAGCTDQVPYPRWITHRFSTQQTTRLRDAARNFGVTLNDLLLTQSFLALDDWFAMHRPAARDQFLRIMVPTNLRLPDDRATPAANIVSLVNLDRRPARYKSPRQLLKRLSLEMAIIKRCRLGITMHHLARLARRFRKFRWLVRDDRCLCTCVLSNLGDTAGQFQTEAPAAGSTGGDRSIEVVALDFLPPIRPWTAAALGVLTYRGQLAITLHCDVALPRGTDRELLGMLVARLDEAGAGQVEMAAPRPTIAEDASEAMFDTSKQAI